MILEAIMTQNLSEEQLKKKRRETSRMMRPKNWMNGRGMTQPEIHVFRMFSEVFKRHNKDDADALFIVGTKTTTPSLSEVSQRQ